MHGTRIGFASAVVVCSLVVAGPATPAFADHHEAALIAEALSAAPAELAEGAKVMDWAFEVLREGDNGWTCMPTPPHLEGTAPMCMDEVWMEWADAYLNKKDYAGGKFGVSYMLAGDEGASNIDPYAEGPTDDNQWVKEGPHIMLLVSDPAQLEGMSTDPWNGGPYVMWKGTPYAHIMMPAAEGESSVAAEIKAAIMASNDYSRQELKDQEGLVSKDGSLEFWSSGGLMQWAAPDAAGSEYEKFSISAKHIKVIELPGGEAAVAMYYSEGSMHVKGRAAVNHYMTRVTQVYVKEDGKWVVRAAHWSPIAGGSGTNQTSLD